MTLSWPKKQTIDPDGVNRSTEYTYRLDDSVLTSKLSDVSGAASYVDTAYDAMGRVTSQSVRSSAAGRPDAWWRMDEQAGMMAFDSTTGNRQMYGVGGVSWAWMLGVLRHFRTCATDRRSPGAPTGFPSPLHCDNW